LKRESTFKLILGNVLFKILNWKHNAQSIILAHSAAKDA
jgi:hypothetical protein